MTVFASQKHTHGRVAGRIYKGTRLRAFGGGLEHNSGAFDTDALLEWGGICVVRRSRMDYGVRLELAENLVDLRVVGYVDGVVEHTVFELVFDGNGFGGAAHDGDGGCALVEQALHYVSSEETASTGD